MWARQDVRGRQEGLKRFDHPELGRIDLEFTAFQLLSNRHCVSTYMPQPMPGARPGYEKPPYRDWLDRPDTRAGPLDDSHRRLLARNVARPKCGRRQAARRRPVATSFPEGRTKIRRPIDPDEGATGRTLQRLLTATRSPKSVRTVPKPKSVRTSRALWCREVICIHSRNPQFLIAWALRDVKP